MLIFFFIFILIAACVASFSSQIKISLIALWILGLLIGALYLIIGAEFLAIIQWILSTLTTLFFVFFSVIFGEFYPNFDMKMNRLDILLLSCGVFCSFFIFQMMNSFSHSFFLEDVLLHIHSENLFLLGKTLTQEYILGLEILGLIFLCVLVGAGVISRIQEGNADNDDFT